MTKLRDRHRQRGGLVVHGMVVALLFVGIARSAGAGPTFIVNSTADVAAGPITSDGICETATGNGICTLRAAIMEANASADAIVRVPAGLYALTIPSTGDGHPENGDLDVLAPMKIEGEGPSVSVVDGLDSKRVFRIELVQVSDRVEMRGLTIQGGRALPADGGGILALGPTLLEDMHVYGNRASGGGGIATGSSMTLRRSIVESNSATVFAGGGLLVGPSASASIEDSRIESNFGATSGGGIFVMSGGSMRVERTAVVRNSADSTNSGTSGGGIGSSGDVVVLNSIFHGNVSGNSGAGLHQFSGATTLLNITMSQNDGWMAVVGNPPSGAISYSGVEDVPLLGRSIVTSNFGSECKPFIFSLDYNIVESVDLCRLTGQLANVIYGTGFASTSFNGGFSPDVPSLFTSAQDAVPISSCLDELGGPLATDFRGHRRKAPVCDIGAHDSDAVYAPTPLLGVNLVRNGGGSGQELGLASTIANPSGLDRYQAPYWAQNGPMVQLLYGSPGGYPTLAQTPPASGHKFFSGGENAFTTAKQSFDISEIAAQVDAGDLPYEVAGAFGGYSTNDDRATMVTEFFNASGQFIGGFSLGGFTAADRGNQTRLIRDARNGILPVGTRIIGLTLYFERFDGLANDGYADGLSVTLPEPGMIAGLGTAIISSAAFARRRGRLQRSKDRTPSSNGVVRKVFRSTT